MTPLKTMKDFDEEFVEKGADLEHQRWARWQKYIHSLCSKNPDSSLTISKERVEHWEKEIATLYSELTEELKEYDRKETRNYLPLLHSQIEKILEEVKNCVPDKIKMKHALKTHSVGGAGYTIGSNSCREQILTNIKERFGE